MKKVNYNQVTIACLLSFTMLTTSGCIVEKKSEIARKNPMSSQIIGNVEESIKNIDIDEESSLINDQFEPKIADETNDNHTAEPSVTDDTNDNELNQTEDPIQKFLNQLINTDYGYTSNMQEFYNEYCELIENISMEDNMNIRLHYSKLAYQKLLDSEIPYDIMISELSNLMIEQQLPRCMSDEEYKYNFGNLISTLKEQESLFSTYFTLAYSIHCSTCLEEHEVDLGVTCKILKKEFKKKYQ